MKKITVFLFIVLLLSACGNGISSSLKNDAQEVVDIIVDSHENVELITNNKNRSTIIEFFHDNDYSFENVDDGDPDSFENKEQELVYYIRLLEIANINYIEKLEGNNQDYEEDLKNYKYALNKLNENFNIKVE